MNTKRTMLSNGMQVLTTPLSDSNNITLLVLVKSGSSAEHIPGLAHFVEHTVFKGTLKRPSAFAINNEIETLGGYFNAATAQEYTEYYIKLPNEFCEKAFDILSDILTDSIFDEKELEKEKAVVIEEINMYEDMPIRNVADSFYAFAWPTDALGRSVLGSPEHINTIQRQDIVNYMKQWYVPDNMIISIAGNIDEDISIGLAQKYFGGMHNTSEGYEAYGGGGNLTIFDNMQNVHTDISDKLSLRIEERAVKQSHFCFGVKAFSYHDAGAYPLQVAGSILADGSGSYLWQKVREELGASYYLNNEIDMYANNGIWYIHAGVDNEKLPDVLRLILQGVQKLSEGNIGKEEMLRAKEYLKGDFVMNLEGSEEIARYSAHEWYENGYILSVNEEKEHIDAVTLSQIQSVVNRVYRSKVYVNILTKEADNITLLKEILHR